MTTLNRLANCHNKYQGTAKKVLCVCSAGLLRSPTAANVLHKEFGYNTRAAGITPEYALIPVDQVLLEWADEIVCMSKEQKWRIMDQLPIGCITTVISLDIQDSYEYMNPDLQALIVKRYEEIMNG